MSRRQTRELLTDIKEAVLRINNYMGEMEYEEFLGDFIDPCVSNEKYHWIRKGQ